MLKMLGRVFFENKSLYKKKKPFYNIRIILNKELF